MGSGALYVFDNENLKVFLASSQVAPILSRCNWPTEPKDFVHKVATEFGEPAELYDLIATVFNDKRPEYFDRWKAQGEEA